MRLSDRGGGVSRRRIILTVPEVRPAKERDPQLLDKISIELTVI
ncbi:phage/plasmid-associated DNA primase [Pantoea agglomerans]|nr:phage/plasmid-associated DNA primase [Pantoea agglomerans]MBA8873989.1 phage/plasmid-associated DNA primase [Pantoea agglomerans]